MKPPKYNFYLGKALKASFQKGIHINSQTGLTESRTNYYASAKLNISEYRYLFANCSGLVGEGVALAAFYNSGGSFISYTSLAASNAKDKLVAIPSNAATVAFSYPASCLDAAAYIDSNENFIYGTLPCRPHFKAINKKYSKESGQEFFRESLDGKITVHGEDHEFIKNSDLEDKLVFLITKGGYLYSKNSFNKTDCKLDYNKKYSELKLTAIDSYTTILNKYENKYDLIKLAPATTQIGVFKRPIMQVYLLGANSINNFVGGTYWEEDTLEAIEDEGALKDKYHFKYLLGANEFKIKGANDVNANGVYAGKQGIYTNTKTGYYVQKLATAGKLMLKNAAGDTIYESKFSFNESPSETNINIRPQFGYIEFVSITDSTDTCDTDYFFFYQFFHRTLCDIDASAGTPVVIETIPIDDFTNNRANYKKCTTSIIPGDILVTNLTVPGPTRFGQNDDAEYFTNNVEGVSIYEAYRPLPISRSSWVNASMWFIYSDMAAYAFYDQSLKKAYTLRDSYNIADVIKVLLKKIDPSLRHEATSNYSRFLYDRNMPNFLMYNRFYLFMTPKSNILKGEYDEPAKKAEITLKDVMDMLRDCFRCYWYIEDNRFKIEHISFFMNGGAYTATPKVQLDFNQLIDQFNLKPTQYFQTAVEYDKNDLTSRYEFDWMDDATEVFSGPYIDVKSNYVKADKSESINVGMFSSDIDFMLASPESFSSDGFALLAPTMFLGSYALPIIESTFIDTDKLIYTALAQNFYMSWKYLIKYYMLDMPATSIQIEEGIMYTVQGTKYCMTQDLVYPLEWDPDTVQLITTEIGNARVDSLSISLDTRQVKAGLIYKPQ